MVRRSRHGSHTRYCTSDGNGVAWANRHGLAASAQLTKATLFRKSVTQPPAPEAPGAFFLLGRGLWPLIPSCAQTGIIRAAILNGAKRSEESSVMLHNLYGNYFAWFHQKQF